MGTIGSIDTDSAIGSILSNFSSDYVIHVMEDSLNMRFRPFMDGMPNIPDILERQFNLIRQNAADYTENIEDVRTATYGEIINMICKYYDLTFNGDINSMDSMEVYGVARTLYDIFVARFTNYMFDFFVSYIVNNADSIYAYLANDPNAKKPRENSSYPSKTYIDPKFITIHANMNQVIYNMASYDIPLQELLSYFCDPNTASRLVELLEDNNDIFKNHYAFYITNPITTADVVTNIKLKLQAKTQEAIQL